MNKKYFALIGIVVACLITFPILFSNLEYKRDKKFDEYLGFAYSFHPEPLEIIIKTDINPKWFWDTNKKIEKIEDYVDEIIKIKREDLSFEEIPYEIIIRSKDNKRIND